MTNSWWPLEELSALAVRAARVPAARIEQRAPLDHQSNALYDIWAGDRRLIAKEYLITEEWPDSPAREFRSLELLAPLDIAPRPVHFEAAAPARSPVVIYEYVDGEMWGRRKPKAEQLTRLAQVWLAMNAVPTEGLWPSRNFGQSLESVADRFRGYFQNYAAWAQAEFAPGQPAADLCLKLMEQRRDAVAELESARPPLCFSRADPRFANVIQRPDGRVACVDWEDAGLRDPAMDVADLLTAPNQEDLLTRGEWQPFLQPYLAARAAIDPALGRRLTLYQALFQLYFLAVLVSRNVDRVQASQALMSHVNGLPLNVRLKRYLARALAWPALEFEQQLQQLERVEFFPCESSSSALPLAR